MTPLVGLLAFFIFFLIALLNLAIKDAPIKVPSYIFLGTLFGLRIQFGLSRFYSHQCHGYGLYGIDSIYSCLYIRDYLKAFQAIWPNFYL